MRPASGPLPLADSELDALFAPLADGTLIALAVSGGADSLALLDAMDRWRRRGRRKKPALLVLTVDHRLRIGSTREARAVARVARARGLEARVLSWDGPRPSSDIEGAARSVRYRLLLEAARAAGATYLAVAHHGDDLAEGFLMRLKRGAGVFGLAAMRPRIPLGDIAIVRPLLGLSRARLAATAAAAGLTPVVDPMNADPRFERARLRRVMSLLAEQGLDAERIAAAAVRLADLADAIDEAANAVIANAVAVDEMAVARIDVERFAAGRSEVRARVLVRLLLAIGGEDYPPRHNRLAGLLEAMLAHRADGRFKRTLAGTVVEARGGHFAFWRETGRAGLPTMPLKPGGTLVYDHRFLVAAGTGLPSGLVIGPLGEAGRRAVKVRGAGPAGALAALPAIRRNGRIVAVPSLGWAAETLPVAVREVVFERLAVPPLFPDLADGR